MTSLVVWLDHDHASLFDLAHEAAPPVGIKRESQDENEHAYFHAVAHAMHAAKEVLLIGPGTAKARFLHYLRERDRQAAQRVVGVETCDHPTPGQILATGRRFFHARHQLQGTEARHLR